MATLSGRVIINADDFGLTENINKGIIQTVENGITTEVSLMVNSYGTESAVKYAKEHKLKNVGIHIAIFNVNKGERPYRSIDYENISKTITGKKLLSIVQDELKRFEDIVGTRPSHINGHKHVHFNVGVIDYVLEYAQKYNIYVRKWNEFKEYSLLSPDIDLLKKEFAIHHTKTSDCLFGYKYNFTNPEDSALDYISFLRNDGKGKIVELLFHPGYCDDFEKTITSFIAEREHDRILLTGNHFKNLLAENNIKLISCNDIV